MARDAHRRYRSTIVPQQSKREVMGTASVTIRVEESTQRAVRAIAENFGFNISSIARAFYKQIEREGKIPPSLAEYLEPDKKPLK